MMIDNILAHAAREAEIFRITERQKNLKPGWYASGGGCRFGPMPNEESAWASMKLSSRARAKQFLERGTDYPYPLDARVWRE